jgi:hypothetical protein
LVEIAGLDALELEIEQPMHSLDAPVAVHAVGVPFDVERRGRDVKPRVERVSTGVIRRLRTRTSVSMCSKWS